jgi:hypothetical protein
VRERIAFGVQVVVLSPPTFLPVMRIRRRDIFAVFASLLVLLLAANLVTLLAILRRMPPTMAEIRASSQKRELRSKAPFVYVDVVGSVPVHGEVDANIR